MSSITKSKVTKKKQKFIRLNIDEKLENLLKVLETEYPLLSKVDIIRMLLSKAIKENEKNISLSQILDKQRLNRSEYTNNLTEEDIYKLVYEEN
jgi:hypothetical protein